MTATDWRGGARATPQAATWPTGGAAVVAVLGGLLQAWALAPVPRAWAQVLGLGLLAALVWRGTGVRRHALLAWLHGTAALTGTFWWLFISMHRYGGLPAPLAGLAVLGLAGFLALYGALAVAAWTRWRSGRLVIDVAGWAALWLLVDLARAQWLTGFPWGAAGYAQIDGPLAVLAPWVGVYGMGAVAAALAGLGAAWCLSPGRALAVRLLPVPVLLAGLAWTPPAGSGGDFTRPTRTLSVTLLQGNVPQNEKFDPAQIEAGLIWHAEALSRVDTDLVVTPETAIPLLPEQLPDGYWAGLQRRFGQGRGAALIGLPLGSFERGYTNSVLGLQAAAPAYRYDKHHLVPFGEFIPWGFRWFVDLMAIPLGDFSRGPLAAPTFDVRGERIAPNICYEDLFGEEIAAGFTDAARAPTVLANVSNIGWFGRSVAVDQHLQISRLRALELQRPMLRSTNTGATVIIDHLGRVTHQLAPHTRGVLVGEVQGRSGVTPYAWWAGRWRLWPLWGLGGAGALCMALAARRRRA
ncbi:apolipoprotein N-acyltransferase [Sphaerotilus hippei]|uniref:Apolipoprotein N-acyltransferase n=1 Tax=Sphaerotilus hippei TaxID=744406 RepID=A0A318GZL5_9BURK|nr:apolipoprotein N-acyltransferase [Sphaerotilus hippei]PXW95785.1 apolipoprotein N-acyltransferase [Sphaerotilus hippei]